MLMSLKSRYWGLGENEHDYFVARYVRDVDVHCQIRAGDRGKMQEPSLTSTFLLSNTLLLFSHLQHRMSV